MSLYRTIPTKVKDAIRVIDSHLRKQGFSEAVIRADGLPSPYNDYVFKEKIMDDSDIKNDVEEAGFYLQVALEKMQEAKPNDRSSVDRRYAIVITELEKVIAYFDYHIFRGGVEQSARMD